MCLDSCKRHCLTHDRNYSHILPPAWQIGLDETFLAGMANAMTFVTKGLTDADWEGPANTAEELCLKAILDHASEVIPEVWKIEDRARLKADVMDLREIGFQDIDHEFLFEPETDGIDQSDLGAQMGMQSLSRRDAFRRLRADSASSKSVGRKSNRWWAVAYITRTGPSFSKGVVSACRTQLLLARQSLARSTDSSQKVDRNRH